MKFRIWLFFFSLLLFFPLFSSSIFADNLLQNPGFESVDSSWLTNHSRVWFTYSSDFYLSGSKAARVTNTSSSSYGIEQIISAIEPGEEYSFFGYAHSNDTNTSSIRLRLAWYESTDGSGSQISTVDSNIVNPPTYEWKFLSGGVNAPLNAHSVKLRAILASKTTDVEALAYFDNLAFEKVDSPTPTPTEAPPTIPPVPTNTPTLIPVPTSTGALTNTPTPTPTPASYSNIYISEFLANPESGNEKVEIKNGNSFEIGLVDWQIDDISGGGKDPKKFSATISASGLYLIELDSGTLNNDGDDVRLLDFSGVEKDKRTYSSTTKGKSWSKDSDSDWCETEPSFGQSNPDCPFSTSSPTSTPTLTPTPTSKANTPTPSKKLTPTATPTEKVATESGEILGKEATESGLYLLGESTASATSTPTQESRKPKHFLPLALIGLGAVLIGAALIPFLPKEKIENLKEKVGGIISRA